MKTLFKDNDSFELVSLYDLGSRYLTQGPEQIRVIGFQRNAVWREEKIEALWDSILSGFPIGSILLARYKDYWKQGKREIQVDRANHSEDTIIDEHGEGYVVVDGQQRLNAIAQGFMSFDKTLSHSRLWIDLAKPVNPDQRQFEFHLCTSNNPFGVNGPIQLTRDEKRRALASVEAKDADLSELNLEMTYPYRAKLPVPFFEFWHFIETLILKKESIEGIDDFASTFTKTDWHLSEVVKSIILGKFASTATRDIIHEIVEPLKGKVIQGEDDRIYKVPAILVPQIETKRLGKLFERVNIGGEIPPQAELFFSALKLLFPLINNYVADVYNDKDLNGLLTPTEIVLIAIRLIDPKITRLELDQFDRFTKQKTHNDLLIRLIKSKNGSCSRLIHYLQFIFNTLHYDEKNNPIGLPRELLVRLRPRVWQTLAIWVNKNIKKIEKSGIQPADRLNMIRYAILDTLNYFIEGNRVSAYLKSIVFATLAVEPVLKRRHFPALEIFREVKNKVTEDGYSIRFPTPRSYNSWINKDSTPTRPNGNLLSNEIAILIYCQRQILATWEKSQFHMDIDHISPSQWMILRAGSRPASELWRVRGVQKYLRYYVQNRSGNYRFWPDSLNRAYHDRAPIEKFIHSAMEEETNPDHLRYGLRTVQDVLTASCINSEDAQQWEELCVGNLKVWTDKRFSIFKRLVTNR